MSDKKVVVENGEYHLRQFLKTNQELETLGLEKGKVMEVRDLLRLIEEKTRNMPQSPQSIQMLKVLELENSISLLKDEEAEKLGAVFYEQTKLSDITASDVHSFVELDCQITGEDTKKALPKRIVFECPNCAERVEHRYLEKDKDLLQMYIFNKEKNVIPNKCKCGRKGAFNIVEREYMNFSTLFVRDLLRKEEKFQQTRYQDIRIFVINEDLPKTKVVTIRGQVIIEPSTKKLSVLVEKLTPVKNQLENFKVTDKDIESWKKYFQNHKDILCDQINPDIVGEPRRIAKQVMIDMLHSPCQIFDLEEKKIIRGGMNGVFIGDTKTGKSALARDITNKGFLEVGEYGLAETGSRTGFLYTIDNDRNSLIWGLIPLNDMGLIVIDGVQAMHSDEIGEYRESLEQQEVVVNRSIKGNALARVRNLVCLNSGKKEEKPLNEYIYKCEAISDTYVFNKSADITRFDFFVPFSKDDVSSRDISYRKSEERPIPKDTFMKHVYWVWSRKPEQISFTDKAKELVKHSCEDIIDTYSLDCLPIVHLGYREVLTRWSVSKASQCHSTDKHHEKIIVDSCHVEMAVNTVRSMMKLLELERFKNDVEGNREISESNMIRIHEDLNKIDNRILKEIMHEGKSSTQLASVLDLSTRSIKDHYIKLKKHKLIDTKTGQGTKLTLRGKKFVRWLTHSDSENGKESLPNTGNGEVNLTYFTEKVCIPLLDFLEKHDTGQGVEIQKIVDHFLKEIPDIEKVIEKGGKEGIWFSPKKGYLKKL